MGHRPPLGADTYKINVYVSNGEQDDPAIDFGGGYANLDNDGYPYFVLSKDLLATEGGLRATAAHELYHLFQLSLNIFNAESSWWYWEATAEWATQQRHRHVDAFQLVGA